MDVSDKLVTTSISELALKIKAALTKTNKIQNIREILASYKGSDWEDKAKFDSKNYQRVQLHQDGDLFEIMLLCWDKKQGSAIHNHPENGCAQVILKGNLAEERYDVNSIDKISETTLGAGDSCYIDDKLGYHRISNPNDTPSCSLHVYSPPNFKHTEY